MAHFLKVIMKNAAGQKELISNYIADLEVFILLQKFIKCLFFIVK